MPNKFVESRTMIIDFEMLQIDFLDTLCLIVIHGKFGSKNDLSPATFHTLCFWAYIERYILNTLMTFFMRC